MPKDAMPRTIRMWMALQKLQDSLNCIDGGSQIFEEFTAQFSEAVSEQNIGILEEPMSGTKTTGLGPLEPGHASTQQSPKSKGGICFAEDMHPEQVDQGTSGYGESGQPPSMVQGTKIAAPDQGSASSPWPDPIQVV